MVDRGRFPALRRPFQPGLEHEVRPRAWSGVARVSHVRPFSPPLLEFWQRNAADGPDSRRLRGSATRKAPFEGGNRLGDRDAALRVEARASSGPERRDQAPYGADDRTGGGAESGAWVHRSADPLTENRDKGCIGTPNYPVRSADVPRHQGMTGRPRGSPARNAEALAAPRAAQRHANGRHLPQRRERTIGTRPGIVRPGDARP
jgi:hypothetical protein